MTDIDALSSSELLNLLEAARRREEDRAREDTAPGAGPVVAAEGSTPDVLPDTDALYILTGRRHTAPSAD